MRDEKRTYRLFSALLVGLILPLLVVGVALAVGNISATDKWAWGANVGWVNFKPADDFGGVTVFNDHLEGDAWAENVGWIRLGTHTTGGTHTYANTLATDYGVNRNTTSGVLSGFAWGTNVGWINFNPSNGGVTVSTTGEFSGYAWGENVGWIRLNSGVIERASDRTSVAYKVAASSPTAVTIAAFSAETLWGSGPKLVWETLDESGLSGFHIWRGSAEKAESRLTDALIGAAGGLTGQEYTWQDSASFGWGQRTYYWLEAVNADGSSSFIGPVQVSGIGRLFLPSVAR